MPCGTCYSDGISNIVPFSHIEYILRTTKYPKEVKDLINRAKTASPLYIINIEYSNLDIENKEFNEYIGVALVKNMFFMDC